MYIINNFEVRLLGFYVRLITISVGSLCGAEEGYM